MIRKPGNVKERGAVTVEFALLVSLVILPLFVGVANFGQMIHAQYILTRAANEGVVTAARGVDPRTIVNLYLSKAGLDTTKASIVPTGTNAPTGSEVSVTIGYDLSGMSLIPWDGFLSGNLSATAYFRHG